MLPWSLGIDGLRCSGGDQLVEIQMVQYSIVVARHSG